MALHLLSDVAPSGGGSLRKPIISSVPRTPRTVKAANRVSLVGVSISVSSLNFRKTNRFPNRRLAKMHQHIIL